MLKLKCEKDKLVLFRDKAELSFNISDKKYINVIRKNIESADKNGCGVSIEKKSDVRTYLILEWEEYKPEDLVVVKKSSKIVIPESVAYEISSRMLLLNKSLKTPKRKDE